MKRTMMTLWVVGLVASNAQAANRFIQTITPLEAAQGTSVQLQCTASGSWLLPLRSGQVSVKDPSGKLIAAAKPLAIKGTVGTYTLNLPAAAAKGTWQYTCTMKDQQATASTAATLKVISKAALITGPIPAHNTITQYRGTATCLSCHSKAGTEMINSLHAKWKAPTPELSNTKGQQLGKALGGINTFCTYAMSSKSACFSCHVRSDGNAPHPATVQDVDCLMCHSDTYQRKFVTDATNTQTVTNILGQTKTYVFGKVDSLGNYITSPDYSKMPANTLLTNLARTVHLPTNKSCLRCHATAGGGDWTKRGDMGLNSVNPTVEQDVHLSQNGAALACVDCHSALNHKIGGRGIDLRGTEAAPPTCQGCHTAKPHENTVLNRHAAGQVSCQVCHIRTFAKGGATEMARDWRKPVWNQAFCSGQGGFVGEEIRQANVKPEYVWFNGTSYVYNVGETITPDAKTGVYHMAKAAGKPFDGQSSIVPIKRHLSVMPLHESGKIVPPAIMWMFMTGKFDTAVKKGMAEQGMTGNYSLVSADAEMLITHGVDPKSKAPTCLDCHDNSGHTPDGTKMLPLKALGYHTLPKAVKSCTLCHEQEQLSWANVHQKHRGEISCTSCHIKEPTGLVKPQSQLCSSCHERKSWEGKESHQEHVEEGIKCASCHTLS